MSHGSDEIELVPRSRDYFSLLGQARKRLMACPGDRMHEWRYSHALNLGLNAIYQTFCV